MAHADGIARAERNWGGGLGDLECGGKPPHSKVAFGEMGL